jgi:hypothetical protein
MTIDHERTHNPWIRTPLFLAASFFLAFFIQATVHELGHYGAGLLAGAEGGTVRLHPFYNSRVTFAVDPDPAGQVVVGLAGPMTDLIFALTLSALVWKKRSAMVFPILAWGSLALFGEGFGIVGSLSMLLDTDGPRYYEDVTNLVRIGVPAFPLWIAAILLVASGVVMIALIVPLAGVSPETGFMKRLLAYASFLPFYFLAAVLYIRAFSLIDDNLGVRTGQLAIAAVTALLLAVFHAPIQRLAKPVLSARAVLVPEWSRILIVSGSAAAAFAALLVL